MAKLSLMRAMFQRMEEHKALATTGASGSGSRHQASATSRPDAPTTSSRPGEVPIPLNKTAVTIASICTDLGVSDDDQRWREIQVSNLTY